MGVTKHSKQRDALIKILQSTDTHPTAEWVHEELKKEIPNVSLATVYRNLKHMIELGLAREIYTDNSSRFDANMSEHYHFACKKCHKLIDLFPEEEHPEIKKLSDKGFKIDKCDISIYGVCAECGAIE